MNLSDSESSATPTSLSEVSSFSTQSIFSLQQQIIDQSKSIKKILQECQTNQKNKSFSLFESLFQLFQSEIAMNLALRNQIISERNNRQSDKYYSNDASLFLDKLSQLLGFHVGSFQQAIEIFSDMKEKNSRNKATTSPSKNDEASIFDHSLNSQLVAAKSKINSLKRKLSHANSVIFKQKNAINELKTNNNEYKKIIKDEVRDANFYQVNEIHNDQYIFKLENENRKLKNKISNLQSEIKSLKEHFENSSTDSKIEENNYIDRKNLKSSKSKNDCYNQQFDYDRIELIYSQNEKLRKKLDFYKQMATDFRCENEKLQHQLKIRTECHWSNSSIKDAFRNIQDILGLDYDASPGDTYSAVSSLVCRLHNCM